MFSSKNAERCCCHFFQLRSFALKKQKNWCQSLLLEWPLVFLWNMLVSILGVLGFSVCAGLSLLIMPITRRAFFSLPLQSSYLSDIGHALKKLAMNSVWFLSALLFWWGIKVEIKWSFYSFTLLFLFKNLSSDFWFISLSWTLSWCVFYCMVVLSC